MLRIEPPLEEPASKDSFPRCPHCSERPAAGHQPCPIDLELEGCECCGACAKLCSDIRRHIEEHTPSVFVDRGTGEVEIVYFEPEVSEEENPLGRPEWSGDDGFDLTA